MGHSLIKPYTIRDHWREHRGQCWFRVRLDSKVPSIRRRLRFDGRLPDLWRYAKRRLWKPCNVVAARDLPPTWQDADARLLHICFAILGDVIEHERIFENNGAEGDINDGKSWAWALNEMSRLWLWWTKERLEHAQEYEDSLTRWHDLHMRDMKAYNDAHPAWDETGRMCRPLFPPERFEADETLAEGERMNELERRNEAEDQAMLHRLMNVRPYLWT